MNSIFLLNIEIWHVRYKFATYVLGMTTMFLSMSSDG